MFVFWCAKVQRAPEGKTEYLDCLAELEQKEQRELLGHLVVMEQKETREMMGLMGNQDHKD